MIVVLDLDGCVRKCMDLVAGRSDAHHIIRYHTLNDKTIVQ